MYSASQREVGEHSDRVRLEVRAEFFGGYLEGKSHLREISISGFCLRYGLSYEEYRLVLPVLIFFE